jgi:hypothetical protein
MWRPSASLRSTDIRYATSVYSDKPRVPTVSEAARAAAAQVAAAVGVLSRATFGPQFFCCSQMSQCMVTNHAGNERP